MRALRAEAGDVGFVGIGGREMLGAGLQPLVRINDVAFIGLGMLTQLPAIFRYIREVADAAVAARPDVLVIIDSPELTHRIARRVRKQAPAIPIVDYVSPSVWAWRPGRARAMRAYVDHVLALLPFEPQVHERLGGPPCSYVGHPLVEQLDELRPNADEALRRRADPPVLLVLPGSRRGEIRRLPRFSATRSALLKDRVGAVRGGRADGPASAGRRPGGDRVLAGAAAHRGRRRREMGGVPDRPRGAGEVRHRDARTGAGRRADGRRLQGRRCSKR